MKDEAHLLTNILLDKTAREDERHDAAIDLGEYNNQDVLKALIKIASEPNEEIIIVDNSAESIAEICLGLNYFDEDSFKKLIPFAQRIVFRYIMASKPDLIKEPFQGELVKNLIIKLINRKLNSLLV